MSECGRGLSSAIGAMKKQDRIEGRPDVMFGNPVVRGTRVPVELILRKLGAGDTPEDVLRQHPRLRREDLYAALRFAADLVAGEDVVFE